MEITINYNGEEKICQCNDTKQKIGDLFIVYWPKGDINSLTILYSGKVINKDLSISKFVTKGDNERKKMNILITSEEKKSTIIKSKDIICPKCKAKAKLDIIDYKIFIQCMEGHNLGNILLNEYDNTQKIDLADIVCEICKKENKAESYQNIFYKCIQCDTNICIKCQSKHQSEYNEHNIINYDDKNYICKKHNEKYSSYCKDCAINTCMYCEKEYILDEENEEKDNIEEEENDEKYYKHQFHDVMNFTKILPNLKELKINFNKLKNKINEFK